jgi:hypothetical protein
MNAHAVVMRYARVPLVLRSPYLPSRMRQWRALAVSLSDCRNYLHAFIPPSAGNASPFTWLGALSTRAESLMPAFASATRVWMAGAGLIQSVPIDRRMAGRLAAAAVTGAIAALAIINNERERPGAIGIASGSETVIFRHAAVQKLPVEDDGEPMADAAVDSGPLSYPRPVQTIRFVSATSSVAAKSDEAPGITKVGAFVAFAGRPAASDSDVAEWPAIRRRPGVANMDEVDKYLWEVYQRTPTKRDHSGDFTWKDPAAAKRMGLSLPDYTISGMDPDFREQLYHAGQAMDAAGIQWSILSAFRDDYRQRLASGFKARVGRSLHGGSGATGGWGHGRAVDLTSAEGDASVVWNWIDANGEKFGLHRPIPRPDPAHTQSRGDWHKVGVALRETRLRIAEVEKSTAKKVAKAGL